MILNSHVLIDREKSKYADFFYPEDGYVLWRDNEVTNLDENGLPIFYYRQYNCLKRFFEEEALHIWTKPISEVDQNKIA